MRPMSQAPSRKRVNTMNAESRSKNTKSLFLGLFFASSSLLVTCLLALLILFVSAELKASLAYEQIQKLCIPKNWNSEAAKRALGQSNLHKKIATHLSQSSLVSKYVSPISKIKPQLPLKLVEIIDALEEDKSSPATDKISTFIHELEMLPEYSAAIQANHSLAATVSKIKGLLGEYQNQNRQLNSIKASSTLTLKLDKELSLKRQYQLIVRGLSDFLSLSTLNNNLRENNESISKSAENEMPRYKQGLLAELPIIEGIPDGIIDTTMLKAEAKKAGGGLRFSTGELSDQDIFQTINGMRSSSNEILASINEATTEIKNLSQESQEIEAKLSITADSLTENLLTLFSQIATDNPEIGQALLSLNVF